MMTNEQLIDRALDLLEGGLRRGKIPAKMFTMDRPGAPEYGKSGCIKGWLAALLGKAGFNVIWPVAVFSLFYPHAIKPDNWSSITRREAADAIARFRAGKEPWPRVRS